MASKPNIHTVQLPNGDWATKREGKPTPLSTHKTQADAMKQGAFLAKLDGVEHVIHGRDGKIRDKDSYGNDPFPPRDKRH
jgi:hypothetical protein